MNDVLQVPMSKELRKKATLAALNQGYSSLQESVRIYLRQLADNKIETRLSPVVKEIKLSPKAIRRYDKILDDIDEGKGISFTANSVDELMEHLMKSR
ncbi:hypothetical protein COW83_04930 [Candidatus Collierbacteria bacterium CG22_combo_CG10-13_8_21_14_all_43_12]|uniref:Uncharacterized protein n=2 Tax=Candidatus Collieribacteriota TaxID=1752725 RepID=A0A2H0DUS6_9BACT|nr:MAG: hypothetical protein COW83_04930 [Candidatus Collierbacteria bacterium CG22_combo_CG10-13_8_21_14_all_43_12]PJB47106.1 MAG: hypothetical protein CO104_04560 [Candidatus Collierbacteria bacterium CG_4_9_14_3_um_filter_43_16]